MDWIRRATPAIAWILATLFLASVGHRVLGIGGLVAAVALMYAVTTRWYTRQRAGSRDPTLH